MSKSKVEMTLLTSNKSGILSSIMIKGGKVGLMYRRNNTEKLDDDNSRMVVNFEGALSCSKGEFIDEMESHPEIHLVESLSLGDTEGGMSTSASMVSDTPEPILSTKTPVNTSQAKLNAHDIISPESLQIAEEKLVSVLGPVAPMLIKSAVSKTKHIGDLYVLLAEELDGQEKADFLSLVSGLN